MIWDGDMILGFFFFFLEKNIISICHDHLSQLKTTILFFSIKTENQNMIVTRALVSAHSQGLDSMSKHHIPADVVTIDHR